MSIDDRLSAPDIVGQPVANGIKWEMIFFDEVSSTNSVLRKMASEGAGEGTAVTALSQTEGRGRQGKSFFSPENTGIYLSILLRPELAAEKLGRITTAAAVAVCRAIERVSDKKAKIKWVNDVLVDGKKVGGILTEASFGSGSEKAEYVIVGIGLNVFFPEKGFPEEIKAKAGSIFETKIENVRARLTSELLNSFEELYKGIDSGEYINEYRSRSCLMGKEVIVCRAGEKTPAEVLCIDDECRLKVKFLNGEEELLNSGEVSLKFENYI